MNSSNLCPSHDEADRSSRHFEGVQGEKNFKGELFGVKNIFDFQNEGLMLQTTIEKVYRFPN
jgi:hypothetical protein